MAMGNFKNTALLVICFLCLGASICVAADSSSPRATFEYYKECLGKADVEGADSCFTHESLVKGRRHLKDYMPRLYSVVAQRHYRIESHGERAIIRWDPPDPTQQEFYLVKEDGAWKIDCQFMYDNIIYDQNHRCIWKDGDPEVEQRWMRGEYP
jgi:hypothetical protein